MEQYHLRNTSLPYRNVCWLRLLFPRQQPVAVRAPLIGETVSAEQKLAYRSDRKLLSVCPSRPPLASPTPTVVEPLHLTRLLRLTEPRLPSCPYPFQGV